MLRCNFHLDIFRSYLIDICFKHLGYLFMILVRNQSAGYFCIRLGRQDCFAAFSDITAPYSANIERGAATVAFQCWISFFSKYGFYSNRFFIFCLVKRNLRNHFPLFLRQLFYIVIESWYGYPSILIRDACNHLAQYINRIGNSTTEMPGMQIPVRSLYFNLPISQTTKSGRKRQSLGTNHACVGN